MFLMDILVCIKDVLNNIRPINLSAMLCKNRIYSIIKFVTRFMKINCPVTYRTMAMKIKHAILLRKIKFNSLSSHRILQININI